MRSFTPLVAIPIILATSLCFAAGKGSKTPIQDGKEVTINYTMSVDGQKVDSTYDRSPLTFVQGQGTIMPGLAKGINGLKSGDKKSITVLPEDGYGPVNPQAVMEVPRAQFPAEMDLKPGMALQAGTPNGGQRVLRVVDVKGNTVVVDMNHPLAGKTLTFDVEVLAVK